MVSDAAIPTEMDGPEINVSELMNAGWVYRDPDTLFSAEMWHAYLDLLGRDNFHILAMTVKTDEQGKWFRGQFLISPAGIANLQAYVAGARH